MLTVTVATDDNKFNRTRIINSMAAMQGAHLSYCSFYSRYLGSLRLSWPLQE